MIEILTIDPKKPSSEAISKAISFISDGKLIVYPTDTVYGLGTNALNPNAVLKIFDAKNRPLSMALPIAISNQRMAEQLAFFNKKAYKLITVFWPGALTIILKKKPIVPSIVTGGKDNVGLRVPNDIVSLSIINGAHLPIITTSANKHSFPPPFEAKDVLIQLEKKIDLLLDGGRTKLQISSTVIDLTKRIPKILREGAIAKSMLEKVIGKVEIL